MHKYQLGQGGKKLMYLPHFTLVGCIKYFRFFNRFHHWSTICFRKSERQETSSNTLEKRNITLILAGLVNLYYSFHQITEQHLLRRACLEHLMVNAKNSTWMPTKVLRNVASYFI